MDKAAQPGTCREQGGTDKKSGLATDATEGVVGRTPQMPRKDALGL